MIKDSIRRIGRKVLGSATPTTRTDKTVSVNDLLMDTTAGAVALPVLPDSLRRASGTADDVEFIAASVLERVALGALVLKHKAKRIFEIGTFRGITALTMALNAGDGASLWTLDLPEELGPEEIAATYYAGSQSGFHTLTKDGVSRRLGAALHNYQGPCAVKQLSGDSTTYDFSEYHGRVDLFFVDGCHDYSHAYADTLTAWRCLRPGGTLVWHDYLWKSVQDAVQEAKRTTLNGMAICHIQATSLAYGIKPV